MRLLWLTWKDIQHPEAGGAELVASELCKRLLAEGHCVTMLTSRYAGAAETENLNGIDVIRVGENRYSHTWQALSYYLRHMRSQFDILIEEVNGGAPYFSVFFAGRDNKFLLYHQLARLNWLYEMPKPLGLLGFFVLVPAATRLVSRSHARVITVSESTRISLAKLGFKTSNIGIISEGITIRPVDDLDTVKKYQEPTLLSFGAMRSMKRTLDQIAAFEIAKQRVTNLQMLVAGAADTRYGKTVLARIKNSPYQSNIAYVGEASAHDRLMLLQKSHIIVQTAIEEGWGLTITEAASQGTPAVAYNVAGLRDSIKHSITGITTAEQPEALAEGIVNILGDQALYSKLRHAGWEWSKQITFDQSYHDFKQMVGLA